MNAQRIDDRDMGGEREGVHPESRTPQGGPDDRAAGMRVLMADRRARGYGEQVERDGDGTEHDREAEQRSTPAEPLDERAREWKEDRTGQAAYDGDGQERRRTAFGWHAGDQDRECRFVQDQRPRDTDRCPDCVETRQIAYARRRSE